MANQYQKHYTRAEAQALLPEIRQWLLRLQELRVEVEKYDERLGGLMAQGGDLGGDLVNQWVRRMAGLREVLLEFFKREIQVKDVERGLIDFPAVLGGREVFLCWEQGEEDIEFWHELDAGYGGRERLEGME